MTDEAGRNAEQVVSIEIAAPVQKVWDEITKTGRIQRALYNTVLESTLKPGAKLRYYSPDKKRVFVVGEVVEIDPPRRFVHTYVLMLRPEPPTLVTWTLEETGTGCRVTIVHSGWTDAHKGERSIMAGWKEILGLLKSEVETGDIPLMTKIAYAVMAPLSFMMPASTKAEEVEKAGW
jgi:uncharacterized protein YndB with AHSA1/START domain